MVNSTVQSQRSKDEHEMATGTVKFYNENKGFGFITPDGPGAKDVFVHASALEQSGIQTARFTQEGCRVSFETKPDPKGKGPKAVNIKVL